MHFNNLFKQTRMNGDLYAIVKVTSWLVASLTYARFASSSIKPGNFRLLALLPVILLLPCLPWSFSSISLRGIAAFFLAWLGVFKLILLAFGLGPLSTSLPLSTFIAVASLPIKIRPANKPPYSNSFSNYYQFLISSVELIVLAFVASVYESCKLLVHPLVLCGVYCLLAYRFLDVVLGFPALLVGSLLGLPLEPQADSPLKSTSLHDFWGRRWNLMVTGILRPSVYQPVRARFGVLTGVMAGFLVSGIMHEIMFYYMTLDAPTGEVTTFFVMHGLCTVAEAKARTAGWWKWREHPVVAVPLTLGFVSLTAFWLFFPPFLRGGTDEKGAEELAAVLRLAMNGSRAVFKWVWD